MLSGESAKREVPDTVAPTHSPQVAARLQRWMNPLDISITPKSTKPINQIRATLALVVRHLIAHHRLRAAVKAGLSDFRSAGSVIGALCS
jgi:hypothetical protein